MAMKFYEPSSTFKQAVQSLKINTRVSATGIYGSFTLPKDTNEKLVFFAGGIGITPFISQLRTLRATNEVRDIILVYAASSTDEIGYQKELAEFGVKTYVASPAGKGILKSFKHIVSPRVTVEDIQEYEPLITQRTAYISGPPSFVRSIKKQFKNLGGKRVKTDYFTGY